MFSYEDLEVYKKASLVNQKICRLIKESKTMAAFATNQLGRACLSIMINIAEGIAKFSKKDRRNFYITARGSVFECSAPVRSLYDEGEIIEESKQDLYSSHEEISKMFFGMIKHLESQ